MQKLKETINYIMQRQNNWRRHSRSHGGHSGGSRSGRGGRSGGNRSGASRAHSSGAKNILRQNMDSNGPLGRVKGNPQQIAEKYLNFAREAMGDSDRVLMESCLQYAEHYHRLIAPFQKEQIGRQADTENNVEDEDGIEEEGGYQDRKLQDDSRYIQRARHRMNERGDVGRSYGRADDDHNFDSHTDDMVEDNISDGADDLPSFLKIDQQQDLGRGRAKKSDR